MSTAEPFAVFVSTCRASLRRIANRTSGEHSIHDVQNEAWLVADQIGFVGTSINVPN